MATAISTQTLDSSKPAVYGNVTYDYWRSGNYMVYKVTVSAWLGRNGWRNNRWACKLWVNGEEIWSNQTLKNQTSGNLGTDPYSKTTNEIWIPVNSGSISVQVQFADTGYSTGWDPSQSNFTNWGTYYGSLAVSAPSAPGAPGYVSIPSSIAPDQTANISWGSASGGTNGVSGYQLSYTKDGGSNWIYVDVSGTSYSLNLNSAGFVNGSVLIATVRSYSTVNGSRYYSGWTYSGNTTTSFVAPSTPSTVTIPNSIAPDKTASISWSAASGGSNGVKGYAYQWSKDGGSTWSTEKTTTSTSLSLNLGANGFVNGSRLAFRVRSYTTGQGNNYYSNYKTSSVTTTSFVAPTVPQNQTISYDMSEPIPTGIYKASWKAPTSTGTNGISGYSIQWLKNGENFGSEYDVTGTSAEKETTEDTIQPNDTISFKVRAYTIGQNNKYYSNYVTSGTITIVSDKFIYISQNGGSFIKYKAYISVNGGGFKEIKKEKLKVIQ